MVLRNVMWSNGVDRVVGVWELSRKVVRVLCWNLVMREVEVWIVV